MRAVDLRLQQVVGVALALVFLFRIGTVTADWRTADPIIQAYRTAFASLEPGSVLFQFDQDTSYPSPLRDPQRWNPPLDKIVALATLDGVFVPELYLKLGQQPVLYRDSDAPFRAFRYGSDQRPVPVADDAMLRAWVAGLVRGFPDLQHRFSAVYVAVYDPHDFFGRRCPARGWWRYYRSTVYTGSAPLQVDRTGLRFGPSYIDFSDKAFRRMRLPAGRMARTDMWIRYARAGRPPSSPRGQ